MTRASATPLRRVVRSINGEMVVELTDRLLTLRPLGTRRGGPQEIQVTHGQVYQRAMERRAEERRASRLRKRRGPRIY